MPAIGPYTQAIKANDMVFLSGQIPADSQAKLIEGTIAEKTHKMCQNAKAVLEAAGSSLDKAVRVTVRYTFDISKAFTDDFVGLLSKYG
jgi:2-iminobutanoate/2-iminopropanoate deaminase